MNQAIITEYGEPSPAIKAKSEEIKSLPVHAHNVGDIVIVPPSDYGVVLLILPNSSSPPTDWMYGVVCEENLDRIYYFPAASVVKRSN